MLIKQYAMNLSIITRREIKLGNLNLRPSASCRTAAGLCHRHEGVIRESHANDRQTPRHQQSHSNPSLTSSLPPNLLLLRVNQRARLHRDERRLKMVHQKIDERPGARCLISLTGVVDKQVRRRQRSIRQNEFQPAALNIFRQIPFRADQYSVPVECPAQHDIAVIA